MVRPGDVVVFSASTKRYTVTSEVVGGKVNITLGEGHGIRFTPTTKVSCDVLRVVKSGNGKLP